MENRPPRQMPTSARPLEETRGAIDSTSALLSASRRAPKTSGRHQRKRRATLRRRVRRIEIRIIEVMGM